MKTIRTFWHGTDFGLYEKLCVKSFLAHGHEVEVYAYDPIQLPHGVTLCDAAEILPRSQLFSFKAGPGKGSFAAFADLFRYKLLLEKGGIWTDADVLCQKPLFDLPDYFIGIERPGLLNNALISLPQGFCEQLYIAAVSLGQDVLWGQTGPELITKQFQTAPDPAIVILSSEYFYPIPPNHAPQLALSALAAGCIEATKNSYCVHWWNEMFRRISFPKDRLPPAASFLSQHAIKLLDECDLKFWDESLVEAWLANYNDAELFRFQKTHNPQNALDRGDGTHQRISGRTTAHSGKILLVNHDLTISGASLMLFALAKHLVQSGYAIDVMSVRDNQGKLRAEYEALGAGFPDRIKSKSYCLCIANTIFSAPVVAQLSDHVKTVWWIHEADNGLDVALNDPKLHWSAFSKAHRIIFPIKKQRDSIYQSFVYRLTEGRCVILSNGIRLPDNILPMERTARKRIVSVANIDQRKRQGDLLAACEKLGDLNIEVILIGQFHWMSDQGHAALERDRARGTNRYHLLGALDHDEAMRWLASADFLVHPAGVETQPLAPIEAAMLGIPMILADIEVYEGTWRHGHNCLLHGVGDIDLLAGSISLLGHIPPMAARLANEARITAKRFSQESFLRRFDDLICELLE